MYKIDRRGGRGAGVQKSFNRTDPARLRKCLKLNPIINTNLIEKVVMYKLIGVEGAGSKNRCLGQTLLSYCCDKKAHYRQ